MDIKDLLVMASAMRSKEEIIDSLQECIQEIKLGVDPHAEHKLAMHCQMYLVNTMTGGDLEKAVKLTQDMEKEAKQRSFFNPGNN